MAYLTIDFETANPRRDSACSVGVARFEGGDVTHTWSTLIDPQDEFAPINVGVHGIRPEDVRGAPTFMEAMERVVELAQDVECIVAHNAAFDLSVLRASLERHGAAIHGLRFACTLVFSRRWFPGWPTYSLGYVVQRLDLWDACGPGGHHNAMWDALACGAVARAGLDTMGVTTWEDAAKQLKVSLGTLDGFDYRGCSGPSVSRPIRPSPAVEPDPDHPLHGLRVAFTGALSVLNRREAAQMVTDAGGEFSTSVTRSTDLLVVGTRVVERLAGHARSAKERRAVELAEAGYPIEIIGEDDFLELIAR